VIDKKKKKKKMGVGIIKYHERKVFASGNQVFVQAVYN
jgi:hypothetical protein